MAKHHLTRLNADERDPYGLVSRDMIYNPHHIYHMLRYEEPVYWSPLLNAWLLTRYADVSAAFRNPFLSNQLRRAVGSAQLSPEMRERMAPIDKHLSLWVLNLDGPDHRALRSLLNKVFTPHAIERMRPHIVQVANELIDSIQHLDGADLVATFAYELPVRVIADMYGVPANGRPLLRAWSKDISAFFEYGPAKLNVVDKMTSSVMQMTEYLREVVNDDRRHPQENILGSLIRAAERGVTLTEPQLLATSVMILYAGHDSTVNLIGNGVLALLTHRDQMARLKENPTLMRSAVHEFLRYDSPVMRHDRVASTDLELHGQLIRAGQRIILGIGAANRDPERFDYPDRLDVGRADSNKHLTFGYGPHACLGAALACMQAEIAIEAVIQRLPRIRLDVTAPEWREHFNFRGLRKLPVTF